MLEIKKYFVKNTSFKKNTQRYNKVLFKNLQNNIKSKKVINSRLLFSVKFCSKYYSLHISAILS